MEFVQLGQYIAAFALVVGLIGLMALVLRKYGNPAMRIRARREARLELVESLAIDARSRLLLVRRDDTEHLLVKSGERFTLIEADIPVLWEEEAEGKAEEEADSDDGEEPSPHTGPTLSLGIRKERKSDAA